MKKITLERYVIVNEEETFISVICTGDAGFTMGAIENVEDESKNILNEYPKLYNLKGAQIILKRRPSCKMKKVKVTYEIDD